MSDRFPLFVPSSKGLCCKLPFFVVHMFISFANVIYDILMHDDTLGCDASSDVAVYSLCNAF